MEKRAKENKKSLILKQLLQRYIPIYVHGKHSWHVTGISGEDFVTEQTLSSDVVEYIRNRKANQQRGLCFSFWYRSELIQSDSNRIHLFRPRIGDLCCKIMKLNEWLRMLIMISNNRLHGALLLQPLLFCVGARLCH